MSDFEKFMTDGTEPFGDKKTIYYAAFREAPVRDKVEPSIVANKTSEFRPKYG